MTPNQIILQVRDKDNVHLTSVRFNFKEPARLLDTVNKVLPLLFQADTSMVEINCLPIHVADVGIEQKNEVIKQREQQ